MRVFQIFQQKFCSLEDHRATISIAESSFGKKNMALSINSSSNKNVQSNIHCKVIQRSKGVNIHNNIQKVILKEILQMVSI